MKVNSINTHLLSTYYVTGTGYVFLKDIRERHSYENCSAVLHILTNESMQCEGTTALAWESQGNLHKEEVLDWVMKDEQELA